MTRTKSIFLALLAVVLSPMAANADPISFNFSQAGFDEGASITGMFIGDDLDNNGQLSSFEGEISGFMVSFSGNTSVQAFTLGLGDLFGLVYDLDGGPLGDGLSLDIEGIGADNGIFTYLAGPGPFGTCGVDPFCGAVFGPLGESFSGEFVLVTAVPEPGTLALLGLGLLGMAAARRRKKA